MYKQPGIGAKLGNTVVGVFHKLGLGVGGSQRLICRGRKSGEPRSVPVNPLELESTTYLVAPRGTTNWARNLRAAGEGELQLGRKSRHCTAEEIPDSEKLPVLRGYLEKWAGSTKSYFEADADAPDERLREIAPLHPCFRLSFSE